MKVPISNDMTIKFSTLIATLALCLAELPRSSTAADRLPDLGMAWLSDLTIDNTTDGRRLLRFTTIIVNIGAGAFELHGKRASTLDPDMDVTQRVYNDTGGCRDIVTTG
jgi:hypothetical protein